MRKSIKAIAAALTLSVLGFGQVTSAMAAQGYLVVNTNSYVAIQQVYAAHAGERDAWTAMSMSYAIAPGTSSHFTMTSTGGNCFYDIKVRFSDGTTQVFTNVNVCHGDRVIAA